MQTRHPKGAAEEAVEFTVEVLLGRLEVISIQMTIQGIDWVIADRGSGELRVEFIINLFSEVVTLKLECLWDSQLDHL